jgi:DNA-directed RNA polymerase subunit RPC12/RpoP
MPKHYNCGGRLEENGREYVCQSCGSTVRTSVIERQAHFERVADSDGPLQEIAQAALEGFDA